MASTPARILSYRPLSQVGLLLLVLPVSLLLQFLLSERKVTTISAPILRMRAQVTVDLLNVSLVPLMVVARLSLAKQTHAAMLASTGLHSSAALGIGARELSPGVTSLILTVATRGTNLVASLTSLSEQRQILHLIIRSFSTLSAYCCDYTLLGSLFCLAIVPASARLS